MPTIKTEDLTGAALDWAVAVAEGKDHSTNQDWGNALVNDLGRCSIAHRNWNGAKYFEPSKNWGHGGPIVERENISLLPPTHRVHRNGGNSSSWGPSGIWSATTWHAGVNGKRSVAWHETDPLIAAMRCCVESKLGESIDVPQHVVDGAQRAAIGLLTVLITVKIAMEPCSYVAIEWPIPVGKSQSPGCIKEGVQQQ